MYLSLGLSFLLSLLPTSYSLDNYHLKSVVNYSDGAFVLLYDWSYSGKNALIMMFDKDANYTEQYAQIDNCGFPRLYSDGLIIFPRDELGTGNAILYKLDLNENYSSGISATWQWQYSPYINSDSDGKWLSVIPLQTEGYIVTGGDSWARNTTNWIAQLSQDGSQEWELAGIESFQGWLSIWNDKVVLDCLDRLLLLNSTGESIGDISFQNQTIVDLSPSHSNLLVSLLDEDRYLYFNVISENTFDSSSFSTNDIVDPLAYYTNHPELYSGILNGKHIIVADNIADRNIPYIIYGIENNNYWRKVTNEEHYGFDVQSVTYCENKIVVIGLEESRYDYVQDRIEADFYTSEGEFLESVFIEGKDILTVHECDDSIIIIVETLSGKIEIHSLCIMQQEIVASENLLPFEDRNRLDRVFLEAYPLIVAAYEDCLVVVKTPLN